MVHVKRLKTFEKVNKQCSNLEFLQMVSFKENNEYRNGQSGIIV